MKSLSAKIFEKRLRELNACSELVKWAKGKTSSAAWEKCERADWMLWLLARIGTDKKILVCIACDCAEKALKYVPDGEDRPRIVIDMARKWTRGEVSLEDLLAVAYAAYADAGDAAYAAAYAAYADAADAAYAAAYAAYAAAYAAYADAADAAYAAAYAADAAAYAAESQKNFSDLVRKYVPVLEME